MVYSETSTGVIHDPEAIGAAVRGLGRRMILDAVSAFGALPITMTAHPEVDALIFTPNKCLEALPGFSVAVCPVERLEACAGQAQSWSFDLADIHQNGLANGPGAGRGPLIAWNRPRRRTTARFHSCTSRTVRTSNTMIKMMGMTMR